MASRGHRHRPWFGSGAWIKDMCLCKWEHRTVEMLCFTTTRNRLCSQTLVHKWLWKDNFYKKKVKQRPIHSCGEPPFMHQQVFISYWARSDVLEPLAHIGAILNCSAASLLSVPTTIWVSGTQAHPGKQREMQMILHEYIHFNQPLYSS